MDKLLLDEVIDCLPKGRTKYYYYKDRYALMLLSYQIGKGKTVAELKKSNLKNLLQKAQVKKLLAGLSNGFVEYVNLQDGWLVDGLNEIQPFVLTVGRWGGEAPRWQQTTRHGYNLVVQLNFSNAHDAQYRRLVKPEYGALLNYFGHPVLRPEGEEALRETLAWARLDIDFDTGEVLIEEIQSDWVREAKGMLSDAQTCRDNGEAFSEWMCVKGKPENVIKYVTQVLAPYIKIWDEAVLAATIDFIKNELGINRVYYHSYESGPRLKHIYGNTPRNLYTRLPKRFCFEKTDESPQFLQKDRRFKQMLRKMATPLWYRLDLDQEFDLDHNLEEERSNAYLS